MKSRFWLVSFNTGCIIPLMLVFKRVKAVESDPPVGNGLIATLMMNRFCLSDFVKAGNEMRRDWTRRLFINGRFNARIAHSEPSRSPVFPFPLLDILLDSDNCQKVNRIPGPPGIDWEHV